MRTLPYNRPAMHDIDAFLTHYRRQRRWTVRLVEAVPEEYFDWAPAPEDFSFGGLVRHIIQSEIFWTRLLVRGARGERYDPFETIPGAPGTARIEAFRESNVSSSRQDRLGATFAACLESWQGIQARTEAELGALTPEHFEVEIEHPLTGIRAPLWEMLVILLEHEAHHRGQISACLKVLGLPQPAVVAMP